MKIIIGMLLLAVSNTLFLKRLSEIEDADAFLRQFNHYLEVNRGDELDFTNEVKACVGTADWDEFILLEQAKGNNCDSFSKEDIEKKKKEIEKKLEEQAKAQGKGGEKNDNNGGEKKPEEGEKKPEGEEKKPEGGENKGDNNLTADKADKPKEDNNAQGDKPNEGEKGKDGKDANQDKSKADAVCKKEVDAVKSTVKGSADFIKEKIKLPPKKNTGGEEKPTPKKEETGPMSERLAKQARKNLLVFQAYSRVFLINANSGISSGPQDQKTTQLKNAIMKMVNSMLKCAKPTIDLKKPSDIKAGALEERLNKATSYLEHKPFLFNIYFDLLDPVFKLAQGK